MSMCSGGEGKADNKIDPPLNAYSSIYVFDNETVMPLALHKQQLHNQEGRAEQCISTFQIMNYFELY